MAEYIPEKEDNKSGEITKTRRKSTHRRRRSTQSSSFDEETARRRLNFQVAGLALPALLMLGGGGMLAALYLLNEPGMPLPEPLVRTSTVMLATGAVIFTIALVIGWIKSWAEHSRLEREKREQEKASVAARGKRRSPHRRHRTSQRRTADE